MKKSYPRGGQDGKRVPMATVRGTEDRAVGGGRSDFPPSGLSANFGTASGMDWLFWRPFDIIVCSPMRNGGQAYTVKSRQWHWFVWDRHQGRCAGFG